MKFTGFILLLATGPLFAQDTTKVVQIHEIVVHSTRTNSRIEDLPMKVEVLGPEDMQEEGGIKPANVASLLGDLSVIHIQNTSAISGNNAIRMQGMDGKYTQLLRDGLPLYEGLSGNFGVLAIPPLDLKQIEIIKGSVSTLYGGGAIAGMINFISKTPGDKPSLDILLNRSTLKENNANLYYSQKWRKTGLTFFGGVTHQNATDVNKDGFSDVPQLRQYLVHPKFFWYIHPNTTFTAGYQGTFEQRTGGGTYYTEKNNSNRNSLDLQLTHKAFTIKSNASLYHLLHTEGNFLLLGKQLNTHTEASYKWHGIVLGMNNTSEAYTRDHHDSSRIGSYTYNTVGFFAQDGIQLTKQLMIEGGLRADHHNIYGWFLLPRLAMVYKPIHDLSVRLSAGTGYKTAAIFTTQTQLLGYKTLAAMPDGLKAERSKGLNFDANYHTTLGELDLTLNQAFYYSHVKHPILPVFRSDNLYELQTQNDPLHSAGTDTYVRLEMDHVELYLGYNHTISKISTTYVPFAPQDKFAATLAYEIEDKWRVGIENSWNGHQYLYNNEKAPNYWFWAAMVSRQIGDHVTMVLNGENLFDVRQGKHSPLYTGTVNDPTFVPLWGPVDGRQINVSVKWNL
ncbi:TonB-dependent receptor plug domain-containing protein [Chitinophaga sp. LS1]|uniref:TonB-dependent receptor plug domain-containing protein n=1 Tax=Chitinophaga sp. LS1 TaxID=3051176 RepID=UPI002AAAEEA3|nr:TonB-dependent receptor [Chitinophaga sp. LS1]WPV63839.1 TonB-dependent receptor [Chitinophaga sp. LS1]